MNLLRWIFDRYWRWIDVGNRHRVGKRFAHLIQNAVVSSPAKEGLAIAMVIAACAAASLVAG